MSPRYRELPPPPYLAADVECLWAVETGGGHPAYRVLPDGCTDVLVLPGAAGVPRLAVAGTMSRHQEVALPPGERLLGIRFRPGMAVRFLPLPASELTDRTVPLDALWGGAAAASLEGRLAETGAVEEALGLLAARLAPAAPPGPVQRLCGWLAARRGLVRIDDLASHAGLSPRQLRRLFLEQAGVGPKQLARILRFRHAVALAAAVPRADWAGLAADCGYADQAHLIHEFGALAGCTPRQLAGGLGR